MSLASELLALQQRQGQKPPQQGQPQLQQSWVQDLINSKNQAGGERLKRKPIGFDFKRDPFDPSSYYKQLGQYRDISTAATAVVQQEAQNRAEAARQRDLEEAQNAARGAGGPFGAVAGNAVVNLSKKYNLKRMNKNYQIHQGLT